jgi:hypothetical protein
MAFSKSFAKTTEKSVYPKWVEVYLTEEEEREEEKKCRVENVRLMKECLEDARKIFASEKLKGYETSLITLTIALFEKRASHSVYWKENKAKEKFDKKNSKE